MDRPTMEANAIQICDVSFRYNKVNVLENIYMTVPRCCIYALLGPSGSGKTTLLRLMLGRMKCNSGVISIFGNDKPGHFNRIIGYMPQSQALSPEFTIGETINYFASLYQLSQKKFIPIKENLKRIFCLPDDAQQVSTLSGGQQKSLSLALVFLHSPKLVFLDEPTVGTDPVLGDQIWSYLRSNCTENGLTVIIVTHYIQEASLADHIGMMRNGRMIEQGMPKMLYCKYNETNLETIFIKICTAKMPAPVNDEQKVQAYQNIAEYLSYNNDKSVNGHLVPRNNYKRVPMKPDDYDVSMSTSSLLWLLFILVRRNIYKFLASKVTSVMLFSPVYCTLLMCITFKVDKIMLPTAVYNQEISPLYSNKFQREITNFSIHHIKYLPFDTLDDAVKSVHNGQAVAAIWFDSNFSTALVQRALASVNAYDGRNNGKHLEKRQTQTTTTEKIITDRSTIINVMEMDSTTPNTLTTLTDMSNFIPSETAFQPETTTVEDKSGEISSENSSEYEYDYEDNSEEYEEEQTISNETLRASTIKVFIDNANMFYAQPLMDLLSFGSWELFNQVVEEQGHVSITSPVQIKEVVYAEGTETPDFLLSGYMVGFLYLSQVTLTSQLLIMERNDGFFDRAIVAGAKHSLMFFSHFITNLLFSSIQVFLMMLVGFVWYGIPNFGSYWLIFLLIFFQSTSSIMTGLMISAICRQTFSAFFIALSITLSQLFTSGAIFPIISFDPVIKFFLNITPIAMPVESLRNVMLRGWDLNRYHVLHGLFANVATTIVFGAVALYFFKKRS